uniref:Prostaglandin E synthase n=1 Tax=Junco hyemalis TaxID=40217 RepID=A0A8C5IUH5_JUNHY
MHGSAETFVFMKSGNKFGQVKSPQDFKIRGKASTCGVPEGCEQVGTVSGCLFQAFANPEDALRNGGLQFYRQDPDVERCRRAHRNDMENIFPFLFLGAIYSLLDPSPTVARIHFLIFCVGRIVHTIAYLLQLRAPTRSVAYGVAQLPCFSMALQILLATTPHW